MIRLRSQAVRFILTLSFLPIGALSARAQESTLIKGGRVFLPGGKFDAVDIVVTGDRITLVEKGAAAPAGAKVIDAAGLTVYPGLIDSFCLAGVITAPTPAAPAPSGGGGGGQRPRGQQGNRNATPAPPLPAGPLPFRKPTEGWNGKSEGIEALRANGFTSVVLGSRGALTPGETIWVPLVPLAEKAAPVGYKSVGVNVNFQTRGANTYPGTLMGAVAFVRQALLEGLDAVQRPTDKSDPRLDALGAAATGKTITLIQANTRNEVLRALRVAKDTPMKPVLLGGKDASVVADRVKESKASILLTEDWAPATDLQKAGLSFAFGSGNANLDKSDVEELFARARGLVEKGMSAAVVIQGLTENAAKLIGADDIGSLKAGSRADIIIVNGELPTKEAKVKQVIIGGKVVFDAK